MSVLTKIIHKFFLSINVYENEEGSNLACVDDSNGICSRPHIDPTSYSHSLQLSLTPDGTHNGGTALEPLSTGNSSVNATAQSFYIRITILKKLQNQLKFIIIVKSIPKWVVY